MRTKILMVCLGNICRSPLAHGILESMMYPEKVFIDSAGTSAIHKGEAPDIRSIGVAEKHYLDIKSQKSRQFIASDFEEFDVIYAMDASNKKNILALAKTEADKQKVKLILNETHPNLNLEVPDPYYGGKNGFENVYQMLHKACLVIAKNLQ